MLSPQKIIALDQDVIDTLPGMIAWKDNAGHYLKASTETARSLGWRHPNDIIGKNDYDHPCYLAEFAAEYQAYDRYLREQGVTKTVFCFSCYSGDNWRLMFGKNGVFYDDQEQVAGTVFNVNDITQTKMFTLFCTLTENDLILLTAKNLRKTMYTIEETYPIETTLTPKESECLFYLLRHKTAKEIAVILQKSHRTIEDTINRIREKLNCHNKKDIIEFSIEHNLLSIIPNSVLVGQP